MLKLSKEGGLFFTPSGGLAGCVHTQTHLPHSNHSVSHKDEKDNKRFHKGCSLTVFFLKPRQDLYKEGGGVKFNKLHPWDESIVQSNKSFGGKDTSAFNSSSPKSLQFHPTLKVIERLILRRRKHNLKGNFVH